MVFNERCIFVSAGLFLLQIGVLSAQNFPVEKIAVGTYTFASLILVYALQVMK